MLTIPDKLQKLFLSKRLTWTMSRVEVMHAEQASKQASKQADVYAYACSQAGVPEASMTSFCELLASLHPAGFLRTACGVRANPFTNSSPLLMSH